MNSSATASEQLRQRHYDMVALCGDVRASATPAERRERFSDIAILTATHIACLRSIIMPSIVSHRSASRAVVLEHLSRAERALQAAVNHHVDVGNPLFNSCFQTFENELMSQVELEDRLIIPLLLESSDNDQVRLAQAVEIHSLRSARDAAHESDWFQTGLH